MKSFYISVVFLFSSLIVFGQSRPKLPYERAFDQYLPPIPQASSLGPNVLINGKPVSPYTKSMMSPQFNNGDLLSTFQNRTANGQKSTYPYDPNTWNNYGSMSTFGNGNISIGHPNATANTQMKMLEDYQNEKMKKEKMAQYYADILEHERKMAQIQEDFPEQVSVAGTEYYRQAYDEILQMLTGEKKLSVKRAVFLTENAYYEPKLNYDWFCGDIDFNATIIKEVIAQAGYSFDNMNARKWGLKKFMADTIYLPDPNGKGNLMQKPMKYDFADPFGKEAWSRQFVTKLMQTWKGQCHSMPLFYLIMAEELGIKAWLSYSPEHSFIKIADDKGNILNYETTNGHYTSDAFVLSSGYVKAEAIRQGAYLDTLGTKGVVASCLFDLAKGYRMKYGYDKFMIKCIDKALEYVPNHMHGNLMKANYHINLLLYILHQCGNPPVERMNEYPIAKAQYYKMHQICKEVDGLGYEEMPQEEYVKWLKTLEDEKSKQIAEPIRP